MELKLVIQITGYKRLSTGRQSGITQSLQVAMQVEIDSS